jgi:hypothetical protein
MTVPATDMSFAGMSGSRMPVMGIGAGFTVIVVPVVMVMTVVIGIGKIETQAGVGAPVGI